MAQINELSVQSEIASGDQFLIWSTLNGQSRRASAQALLEYVEANRNQTREPVFLAQYTLAELPPASQNNGAIVHCLNGNAGQPCVALSNGVNWKVIALGANVS